MTHSDTESETETEDSEYTSSSESSESTALGENVMEELEQIEPLIYKNTNTELSNLFDTFKQTIHQKKERQDKRRKTKNYETLRKIILQKMDEAYEETYFKELSPLKQEHILAQMMEMKRLKSNKPLRLQLLDLNISMTSKSIVMHKMDTMLTMNRSSGEYNKLNHWIETFMSIPFNTSSSLPICKSDGLNACREYITQCKEVLDQAIFGMNEAKIQFMQLVGQWINNPDSVGNSIALKGPMGTGKTTLLKNGICKLLKREIGFITLGGANDGSYLEGHSYTYEGSTYGKIVDVLIQCKTNNPILYFDELDKVSDSPKGEEIIGILTHLTDSTQNTHFIDKYFSEVPIDMSKCLFVFSYNDEQKVSKILRDRMYVIETRGYNTIEKVAITRQFLIPTIIKTLGLELDNVVFSDALLTYIIDTKTPAEKGVRNLKRTLEVIYNKLNLYSLMDPTTSLFNEPVLDVRYPFVLTNHTVDKLVQSNREPSGFLHMYL